MSWLTVEYSERTNEKAAATTFGVGPHPKFTPKVLDVFDKYGVKATFFTMGQETGKYPDAVKDVIRRGHVIGTHTYTHPHDIGADTQAQVIRKLEKCAEVMERSDGKRAYPHRSAGRK